VIVEKHIHEHHQPIIHEKHETLVEEKHVPIIHETHTHETNKEKMDIVMHETVEKPIIDKDVHKPVVTETVEKTVVVKEGEAHLKDATLHAGTDIHGSPLAEDEEYFTDEHGVRVKRKKGFFKKVKDAILH